MTAIPPWLRALCDAHELKLKEIHSVDTFQDDGSFRYHLKFHNGSTVDVKVDKLPIRRAGTGDATVDGVLRGTGPKTSLDLASTLQVLIGPKCLCGETFPYTYHPKCPVHYTHGQTIPAQHPLFDITKEPAVLPPNRKPDTRDYSFEIPVVITIPSN